MARLFYQKDGLLNKVDKVRVVGESGEPVSSDAVKYTPQSLSDAQQQQAGDNISALGTAQLPEAIDQALAQAKASGEFKGDPGPAGPQGNPGQDGAPGKDGAQGPQGEPGKDAAPLQPLTFTGAVSETYDGTKAVSVKIPTVKDVIDALPKWTGGAF